MTTQLESARQASVTPVMEQIARSENVPVDRVMDQVARGLAVIPFNPAHSCSRPAAAGRMFRTKVNANIGRSRAKSCMSEEMQKLNVAVEAGADFVMDLTVGPELSELRKAMLDHCPVPLGTVPVYEAFSRSGGTTESLDEQTLIDVVREQAEDGVDFMTIHAGLLKEQVPLTASRLMGIVSRGGSILAEWMLLNNRENPFFERWDEIMGICREHDVTVSVGDGFRPGCLADASDAAQFAELEVMGELVRRCRDAGVQVMVEGPGHVPFDQIQMNMEREQEVCDGAPFYVLGPVVTDIAPGYDHITSSIGATAAAHYGASLLCYVTPAEHLALPTEEDVRAGVIAYRIAAHAGDISRGHPGAREIDDEMSRARAEFNWERQFELAMDGKRARAVFESARETSNEKDGDDFCSMCGKEFCAIRTSNRIKDAIG